MSETCPSGGTERQLDMWLKLSYPQVTWFIFNVSVCWTEMQSPLGWSEKVSLTLALADAHEQKQRSETHSLSAGKKDESVHLQIT